MRNFSVFVFLLFCSLGTAQTVTLLDPATNAMYPSQMYFCAGEKFSLKADAAASSTGDYAVAKENPSNYPLSPGGTPIVFPATGTNKFSQVIPIGFTFSFYGKDYTNVVAGSNGRLVFTNSPELANLNNINTYIDRPFSGIGAFPLSILPSTDYNKVYRNAPAQELNLAQIFFGYTNLVPASANGTVTYSYKTVTTSEGEPALQISYQNQIQTDGAGSISSSKYNSTILLIKGGKIVINVTNKTEDTYNAILGIQNEDASKWKVPAHNTIPSDYNNGHWKSEGLAMVFTPNQNLTPKFEWSQNATVLSETSDTLSDFSPNDGDILIVKVTYAEDASLVKTGQVKFMRIPKPVITAGGAGGCVTGVNLTVPGDPDLNFEWFLVGNTEVIGTGNSYYATQTGSYFVRASRKTLPVCSVDSDPIPVNRNSTIPAFNESNTPLYYCENSGAASKSINLYNYYPADPTKYSLLFSENGTAISDPSNFVISANTNRTVHIYVNDPASTCTIDQDFVIRFDSLPLPVDNLPKKFCYGSASVDVSQYLPEIGGASFALFDYQYSTDGTSYSTNSVINPKSFPKVWIKILPKNPPAGSCSTISTIVFTEDTKVVANTPTTQLPPQCASATQTFGLESLIPEINPDPNVTVTFHESPQNAADGVGAVAYNYRSGLGYTTLYIRVVDNSTGCVSPDRPTITLLVYRKPTLTANTLTKKNCQGNTFFDLTQNPSTLTNAQPPVSVTLEYYAPNGTLLTGNDITSYNEALWGANPYIKVIYNTTCGDLVTFNLSYNPKPIALRTQIPICSETTYSLEDFKNQVINNPSQYTFTAEDGGALPSSFDVSSGALPKEIRFYIKDNTTGCTSELQTVTFVQNGNSVLTVNEITYELCDPDFDGITTFDLDSKKSIFTTDPAAVFEYFKDASFTQAIPANYTNKTPFAQTVYIRITLPGFCPSDAEIHLKVNIPTKSSTLLEKYFICFNDTLTIDAGPENDSVTWSDGKTGRFADFTQPGNYSVTLQNGVNGCPYTHSFSISDENQPKIQVINQTNTSIEVVAEGGTKPYWYYFNGVKQRSPILQNPTEDSYQIQVQSDTGCFGPPKTVYFIKITNAFTPNGDGKNDVWKIDNLDKMQQVSLLITDRYGRKVFEAANPAKAEWDGKTNGRELPTSSYWYVVSWFDPVTQKSEQRQGWILLKNRN
ncbi:T9SS type B sorting domain-containing protein [Kaistella palustris]|uniref:T9SS type B sorting domain-containing protein n=1 Tax=Kaistella palustris TaxID=493376 RepID=UPI00041D3CA4|nr:T9SS type B sorting domain-containing protein [Kaistella palustris]